MMDRDRDREIEANPAGADAGADSEQPAGTDVDPGLFGKLPRSRPGARSPRRQDGKRGSPRASATPPSPAPAKAAGEERAAAPPPRTAPPPRPREPAARAEDAEAASGGIEELAWAGIAVTAEAATLGVRLLSRAIDAARRATERR